jgi:hypothetical protein
LQIFLGATGSSKADGKGTSRFSRFRYEAWRASTVAIVAPTVSSFAAEMWAIAPSYALTPVFSRNPQQIIPNPGGWLQIKSD